MARVALDSNVLVYAEGMGDARRCTAARTLMSRLPGHLVVVPAQALGELHRVLVGKAGRSPAEARIAILGWADAFDVADSTFEAMRAALDLAADHRMPIWDALILSVAAGAASRWSIRSRPRGTCCSRRCWSERQIRIRAAGCDAQAWSGLPSAQMSLPWTRFGRVGM
jgi:predicted nucleic acid-binding protein